LTIGLGLGRSLLHWARSSWFSGLFRPLTREDHAVGFAVRRPGWQSIYEIEEDIFDRLPVGHPWLDEEPWRLEAPMGTPGRERPGVLHAEFQEVACRRFVRNQPYATNAVDFAF